MDGLDGKSVGDVESWLGMRLSEKEKKEVSKRLHLSTWELNNSFRMDVELNRIITRHMNCLVNNIQPDLKDTLDLIIRAIKSSIEPVIKK